MPTPTPPSVLDLRSLPAPLKELVSCATHADDAALFDIWVQLSRAIAALGPSARRFKSPTAAILCAAAAAAETVVGIADFPENDGD
ncbi:hypothetical protein EsH8_XIII_000029 [Colletotrichum jinshuiense]